MKPPLSRTLFDQLVEQAERSSDATAVICGERSVTYGQLMGRSGRVATALRSLGVGRGDRVGILINNRLEWLEVCFGGSALGAVVVPFSTWSTASELEFLLADSGVCVLVALAGFGEQDFAAILSALIPEATASGAAEWRCDRFPELRHVSILGHAEVPGFADYRSLGEAARLDQRPAPGDGASATDDAMILYTSGSSSRPKAVRMMHCGVVENGFNIGQRQGLRNGDRVLVAPPLFWAYGGVNALPATLTHGATLVLQAKFEPGEALDLIEKHACTAIYTLPGMTSALIRHPDFAPRRTQSLRTGLTIGSPQDVMAAARVLGADEICNVYGGTETYGNCCVTWHHWPLERRANCQGLPLPGVEIRIVDAQTGQRLGAGKPGLVEVKGYLTPGYDGASAIHNADAFTADGFFRSGDIGRLTAAGEFVFVGRDTEMIKKAGINISPAEIEETLLRHPDVSQAGVIGVIDPEKGEIVVAFVVPGRGLSPTAESIETHCRTLASSYKVPDHIEICAALPLTVTGKVMRRDLKRSAMALVARQDG
jgi:fatty-acyl-CoA synthase